MKSSSFAWLIFLYFSIGCTSYPIAPKLLASKKTLLGVMEEDPAKNLSESRISQIKKALTPTKDPYRGELNIASKCLMENLPPQFSTEDSRHQSYLLSFYSLKRNFVIAMCSSDEVLVKTHYQLLYCKKDKSLWLITSFYEENDAWPEPPNSPCP